MPNQSVPVGFRLAGVKCGIKQSGALDIALFASDYDCTAAGVFTQNQVVGAPVIVSRERVPTSNCRAVIINSGNSNACTGERGIVDAKRMATMVAEQLECEAEQVLVCSTGVIGHFLPMEKLGQGIRDVAAQLGNDPQHLQLAAQAIMTTDTIPKFVTRTLVVEGKTITVTGVAKGAAMIAPNMATMLAAVLTDAAIPQEQIQPMLKQAVDQSFNNIIVEGHTSTSDTVLLLANGQSGVAIEGSAREEFQHLLNAVCLELSQKIIRDAEGAGHFVTVNVMGLPCEEDARKIAKAVCEGPLVKTAITGNDPNWGRIVSAAGYAGVTFREEDVSLLINGTLIYESGRPVEYDKLAVSQSMAQGEVEIDLEFKLGAAKITYWTCDLTAEYVRLNADYTT